MKEDGNYTLLTELLLKDLLLPNSKVEENVVWNKLVDSKLTLNSLKNFLLMTKLQLFLLYLKLFEKTSLLLIYSKKFYLLKII